MYWFTVVGMFFDNGNKDFVGERAGLSVTGINANDHALFSDGSIEFDVINSPRCASLVMAKECSGNAQERILHVHLFDERRLTFRVCADSFFFHDAVNYNPTYRCDRASLWRAPKELPHLSAEKVS